MARLSTDDGCRLWTAVTGEGLPVVLIHGGPGWWDVFGDLELPGFRLHRWDQRGCGRSNRALPDRHASCRQIAVPTLLVHGAEDLRPPAVTDSLLKALPNAERVVLDGVAHYPWIEDPDGFQTAVRAFIS